MTQPCKGASIYFIFHHKNSSCNSARFPGCGGGECQQCQGSREKCLTDAPTPNTAHASLKSLWVPFSGLYQEEGPR